MKSLNHYLRDTTANNRYAWNRRLVAIVKWLRRSPAPALDSPARERYRAKFLAREAKWLNENLHSPDPVRRGYAGAFAKHTGLALPDLIEAARIAIDRMKRAEEYAARVSQYQAARARDFSTTTERIWEGQDKNAHLKQVKRTALRKRLK